jgi:uncharacterized membrane protein YqhA
MSRWLMALFYVGLVVALGMLLVVFVEELCSIHASSTRDPKKSSPPC